MRKLSKIKLITSLAGLIIVLMVALIINLNSGRPLFNTILVSTQLNKVVFNNYGIEDTLKAAKDYVEKKGEFKKGFIVYKSVLKKDPNNIEAYMGMAYACGKINNFREAGKYITEMEQRIDSNTKPEVAVDAYYTAAIINNGSFMYEEYTNINKAIAYFNKALEVKGLNDVWRKKYTSYIYVNLGGIYSSLNMYEKAVNCYQKSLEADPNDKTIYYSLANTYCDLGDFNKAYAYIEKISSTFGENNDYLLSMSYYYISKGDYDNAISYLEKAKKIINIPIDKYKLFYFYGKYYEGINNIEKAKESYRNAVDEDIYYVNQYTIQEAAKRLNINFDDINQRIEKEKEENYSKIF